ncbi:PREDICTED: probable arginine--tRNA ligase, mitochondrial [Branchiostoma belcheri]|uniref:Probable arginine--tRNA ligase, mitochondrial n=1 Tax=Branchiostoma belcheri TaxID=7741 RepID=A0A6P4XKM4_BRABE|nr:PREDICTED: probable arginine--tRNA ligase, mitochondrial [Branchiostoma belcheri]
MTEFTHLDISRAAKVREEKIAPWVQVSNPKISSEGEFLLPIKPLIDSGVLPPSAEESGSAHDAIGNLTNKISCQHPVLKVIGNKNGIQFSVDRALLIKSVLSKVQEDRDQYGRHSELFSRNKGEKVIVEYSSPNIAKPFHAGHLRSTIIGNFIARLNHALGNKVVRINYLGDWGVQFGLLAVGFQLFGSEAALQRNPIQHLFEVYVKVNQAAEEREEIHRQAREVFRHLEHGDQAALSLWTRFRDLSVEEYSRIYKRLGVQFDEYSGESMYSERSQKVISQLQQAGLLQTTQRGTGVVDLSEDNSMSFYSTVTRSDGTSLYITRDIVAAIDRYERYKFDKMYYVVDKSQEDHFCQLFKTLEKMGHTWADRCHHVKFGRVQGMKTRRGEVVLLEDILTEAQRQMLDNMQQAATTKHMDDPEEVAETVGITAVLAQDFRGKVLSDYKFDWNRALQSKGDTGVFLQYTHARLCSLERESGMSVPASCDPALLQERQALQLLQQIAGFDQAVHKALTDLEPRHILSYTLQLSHLVAAAHRSLKVKDSPNEVAKARLLLFHSARVTLANGMALLCMTPVDRM